MAVGVVICNIIAVIGYCSCCVVVVVFNVATFVASFIIAALGSCCSRISCCAVVKGTTKINHANSQFCLLYAKNAYVRN